MIGKGMLTTSRSVPRSFPPTVYSFCSSRAMTSPSTTLPARVIASPSATSSSDPNLDSLSKSTSMPMANGRSAAMRSITLPCIARGNGHWRFSSEKVDSSIVTMTIGAVGGRIPRSSKS